MPKKPSRHSTNSRAGRRLRAIRTANDERRPGIEEADLDAGALAEADELVCLNALRGARPVVELDGAAVGAGAPGALAAELAALLQEL